MSPPAVRLAEPVIESCEVLGRQRSGGYHALTVVAPEIAARARPGQFVTVGLDAGLRTILRRPFSIGRAVAEGPKAGAVEIVYDAIGSGTGWIAARRPHDRLNIVGPLGRPYALPETPVPCLLVGGGYGAAPLFYLAEALRRDGNEVAMLLGAAGQDRILGALEAKRLSTSVTFTTEDGSLGIRGRVTDALAEAAARAGAQVIYTCGPMPMLAAVSRLAGELGIPCQVAVEEFMGCGIGVCWTCVVPVRTSRGVALRRSCIDGPVFDGARVEWP